MKIRTTPTLLPAAAAALGTALAFRLPILHLPILIALLGVGLLAAFFGSRRWGGFLAFLALGLLNTAWREELPARRAPPLDWQRPVEAVVAPVDHWRRGSFSWTVPVRVEELLQGEVSTAFPRRLALHVADLEQPPPTAGTLRVRGYLRRSAGFANQPGVDPGPLRLVVKSRQLVEEARPPGAVEALSRSLRGRVEAAYDAVEALRFGPEGDSPTSVPRGGLAMVRALVLGDPAAVSGPWRRALRRGGLSHLLAVSGLHVGLLAGLVWLGLSPLPRVPRLLLLGVALVAYLLLVGPRPALLRATTMGLIAVAALLLRRPPHGANALGTFVLLFLLAQPALVLDLGFQLSVAATAAILALAPRLLDRWQATALGTRLPRWLLSALAVSLAAQVATLPFALPAFHLLVPVSPFLNVLAVPWTAVLLALGLLWTALALATPTLAAATLPVLDLAASPLAALAAVPPLPGWPLPLVISATGACLLALAVLAALWWPRRCGVPFLAVVLLAGLIGLVPSRATQTPPQLWMLDVGQGDAFLLRDGHRAFLLDGGGWTHGDFGGRVLLPALAGLGVRRLDGVVMSHGDQDHCGGLVEIADYLPVGGLWSTAAARESTCGKQLVESRGLPWHELAAGDELTVGRWRLEVLHPPPGEESQVGKDNDGSLVVRAAASPEGPCFLLTGDIERLAEERLVGEGQLSRGCAVLKVAHHGSKSSTTPAFLEAAHPRLALISAGVDNAYGHPAEPVLERIRQRGITIWRTDHHGRVGFEILPGGRLRTTAETWPGRVEGTGPAPRVPGP